jgi:hypothetical protein
LEPSRSAQILHDFKLIKLIVRTCLSREQIPFGIDADEFVLPMVKTGKLIDVVFKLFFSKYLSVVNRPPEHMSLSILLYLPAMDREKFVSPLA